MKLGLSAILALLAICTATAQDIPLSQVLAKPLEFNGKRVAVTGYYVAATETSCLFTTRGAAKRFDIARSVWVEFRTPRVLRHFWRCNCRGVVPLPFQNARSLFVRR
jgi:hypothetical protein